MVYLCYARKGAFKDMMFHKTPTMFVATTDVATYQGLKIVVGADDSASLWNE